MQNKEHYLGPVLIGGAVAGVLSSIPLVSALNCIFCMWMLLGAGLAVMLLQNKTRSVQTGEAAIVGALAGVVCAVITWGIGALLYAAFGMATMVPAAAEGQMGELLAGGGGMALMLGIGCVMNLILYPLFGALGGLLGGLIFKPAPPGGGGGPSDGGFGPPGGGGFGPPGGGGFGPPPGPGGGGFGAPPGGGGFGSPPGGGFGSPPGGGGFGSPPGGGGFGSPPGGGGFGSPPGGGGFGPPGGGGGFGPPGGGGGFGSPPNG